MIRLTDQRGMTLVEALVTIVIGIVVLGSGVTAFTSFLGQSASADRRSDAQDGARLATNQLAIQLRSAMSPGTAGSQPVESVSAYSIVFLAPAPTASLTLNPLGLQHLRYCLGSATGGRQLLFRQTAPYNTASNSAAPATDVCPSSAWTTQLEVAKNLVNGAIPAPLFNQRVDTSGNVTSVGIDAAVDEDPATAPPATRLKSSVELRNVNRPPTAVLSCQPASNGHATCDASASTDPDGQLLSYSWTKNGGALSATGFRLDQPSLSSGATYVFQVTVTDAGYLSASASQSVTMP
jgi:Tfp pilus assembly protein PilV